MKRVVSHLIRQNCYVTGARPAEFCRAVASAPTYPSLRETPFQSGVEHKIVQEEYPITPDYVASSEDGCNYRLDPLAASQGKPFGVNLGDLRMAQDILQNMNFDEVRHFMKGFDLAYRDALTVKKQSMSKEVKKNGEE